MNSSDQDTTTAPAITRKGLGQGLWRITRRDRDYFTFRYRDRRTGLQREKGIGPAASMTEKQARSRIKQLKGSLYAGEEDPIDAAREARAEALRERAAQVTFREFSALYIARTKVNWRNRKNAGQWTNTLEAYCQNLMPLNIRDITTAHIVEALAPIWVTKNVTATRVRQRVETIIDAAAAEARSQRTNANGESPLPLNPAKYDRYLQHLLPVLTHQQKQVRNHASLPHTDIRTFLSDLTARDCASAKALTLQILTATRPSEAAAAKWSEFNFDEGYWLIPPERMKSFVEHKVPIAPQLRAFLIGIPRGKSDFVFAGGAGAHVTTAAMLQLAKRLRPGITCHGFRATFRNWQADETTHPELIAEQALAHVTKNKVVASYRRTKQYKKRESLMRDWADHCMGPILP